jgi:hypothetical protein
MKVRRISLEHVLIVQLLTVAALVQSYAMGSPAQKQETLRKLGRRGGVPVVAIPRETPLVIPPFYDDPEVVSDEELAAVLERIQPKFRQRGLTPNYVEHALRTWSIDATFRDPRAMPGAAMKEFLVDHGRYLASWGEQTPPLLQDRHQGVAIRWGMDDGASVHHDHWLASLTEAGVSLHEPVFTPSQRRKEINDVLQEALRDFRLDEIEIEWSALAFGLWLPPQKTWIGSQGREMSFDMLAERLATGPMKQGTCLGTHRVYSLMALVRLDDEHDILSDAARERAMDFLRSVRDRITASQFPDGHWPSNWMDGADAVGKPIPDDNITDQITATGHHLEWLAIAPIELHPPREAILKAADWLIQTVAAQSPAEMGQRYTFFSHVGNALALWRKTHPAQFWKQWEAEHPATEPRPNIVPEVK